MAAAVRPGGTVTFVREGRPNRECSRVFRTAVPFPRCWIVSTYVPGSAPRAAVTGARSGRSRSTSIRICRPVAVRAVRRLSGDASRFERDLSTRRLRFGLARPSTAFRFEASTRQVEVQPPVRWRSSPVEIAIVSYSHIIWQNYISVGPVRVRRSCRVGNRLSRARPTTSRARPATGRRSLVLSYSSRTSAELSRGS